MSYHSTNMRYRIERSRAERDARMARAGLNSQISPLPDLLSLKEVIESIRSETGEVWRTYTTINGGPMMPSSKGVEVPKVLRQLCRAFYGNNAPYREVVFGNTTHCNDFETWRVNLDDEWETIVFVYTSRWARDRWDGSARTAEFQVYRAQQVRKLSKVFLERGMYLPTPSKVRAPVNKAAIRQGKIDRLRQRKHEWDIKAARAKKALASINRSLLAYQRGGTP